MTQKASRKIEWINIVSPKKADLEFLKKKFNFHDVILRELEHPSARARVERYDGYLYLVYYFPVYNQGEQTSQKAEIDFVITKNAVVTVRYEDSELFAGLRHLEYRNSLDLVYAILEECFQFEERQLRHIAEKVEAIGARLFKDKEREVLKSISLLKRDISEYRIIVRQETSILNSLLEHGPAFWGDGARVYLNDLVGDHLKVVNHIENYREAVADFEYTNNQMMNSKTTDVMKTFTILSFLTFPFVLVTAVFSMNLDGNPLLHIKGAFWIFFCIIAGSVIGLAWYFKKRNWL